MKINGSYADNPVQSTIQEVMSNDTKVSRLSNNSAGSFRGLEQGQIIEGIIREVSDKISIDFSGREIKFPKETVPNAKEGDIRKFKIMEASDKSIVLKEIGSTGDGSSNPILSTKIETDHMIFSENLKSEEESKEESADEEDIANRLTEDDYYMLSRDLLPIEEYNLERLERAVTRIKHQKAVRQDSCDVQKTKIKEQREAAEKTAYAAVIDSGITGLIAERLIEAGLPVTEDNVKSIERALKMSESITKIDDQAKAYLIRNELEPTIQNIYKAEHSGSKKNAPLPAEAWEQLKEPAGKVIEAAGFEVNNDTLKDARWLLESGIPLTKENFAYKQTLNNISGSNFTEAFIEHAAAMISEKELPENADITMPGRQKVINIIKDYNSVTEEALAYAFKETDDISEISLKDIKSGQESINNSQKQTLTTTGVEKAYEWNIQEITAMRQLEEIRLKLTVESGIRLSMKGIHIDTDPLERVVEGLRNLEDSYYKSLMQEADKTCGTEEISLLKQASVQLNEIRESPVSLLAKAFARRDIITVGAMASEGSALRTDMEKAGQAYETVMTVPRKDLGDSIQKAFRNIDDILTDLNLEPVQANQRAVRILSYNNMELNYDNITEMKQYDAKVNDMLKSMQPAVTAELIKRGLNPLNMTVDELRKQADAVKEVIAVNEDEKYSEFLYRMDKQGNLTEEERSAYVGIYRLLHQVNKTDGAAIGSVVKSGRELTLSNLLTAVRTIKNKGINKEINDNFGSLDKLNKKGESITDQINAKAVSEEYGNILVKNVIEQITPGKLHNISENSELGDMSLESLSERLYEEEDREADIEVYQEKLNRLKEVLSGSKEAVRFLKNTRADDSISMIEAAKNMLENGQGIYDEVNKYLKNKKDINNDNKDYNNRSYEDISNDTKVSRLNTNDDIIQSFSEDIIANLEDKEKLTGVFREYIRGISEQISKTSDTSDTDSGQIELLRKISGNLRLIGSLAEKEYYEIPIMTEQGIANMNVTIVHGSSETGKLQIRLNNIHGKVNINVSIKQKEAVLNITAENAAGLDYAKNRENVIKEDAEKSGILLKQINYSTNNYTEGAYLYQRSSYNEEGTAESEDIEVMYSLAKTMVQALLDR